MQQYLFENSIVGISKETLQYSQLNKHITTSPSKLEFYGPAVCIDDNKDKTKECNVYYVNNCEWFSLKITMLVKI